MVSIDWRFLFGCPGNDEKKKRGETEKICLKLPYQIINQKLQKGE